MQGAHLLVQCSDTTALWRLRAAVLRTLDTALQQDEDDAATRVLEPLAAISAESARGAVLEMQQRHPGLLDLQEELHTLFDMRRQARASPPPVPVTRCPNFWPGIAPQQYDAGGSVSLSDLSDRVERCCLNTLAAHQKRRMSRWPDG